jgi:protein-S-isoprenylcysteine O-methyltransferase Ste14
MNIATFVKSKTLIFSTILAVLSVVQGYIMQWSLTPDIQMYIGLVLAVVIAVLRVLTAEPLQK